MAKEKRKNVGGRIAANFRSGNIAEGLAVQMLRPFAAVAQLPRDEDYGIDLIATLIRRDGLSLVAEDSFLVQVKIHTAANFEFAGEGIKWLRQLSLPYFPLVSNLEDATASLYTLNGHVHAIHMARLLDRMNFCVDGDGMDDFPLDNPLMRWSIADCAHPEFQPWAYSVLKPAIRVERANQRYGPMGKLMMLVGGTYEFRDRGPDGLAVNPPRAEDRIEGYPQEEYEVMDALRNVIEAYADLVQNSQTLGEKIEPGLRRLRDSFKELGFDPDPTSRWLK
jgi:hypothetical protein